MKPVTHVKLVKTPLVVSNVLLQRAATFANLALPNFTTRPLILLLVLNVLKTAFNAQ